MNKQKTPLQLTMLQLQWAEKSQEHHSKQKVLQRKILEINIHKNLLKRSSREMNIFLYNSLIKAICKKGRIIQEQHHFSSSLNESCAQPPSWFKTLCLSSKKCRPQWRFQFCIFNCLYSLSNTETKLNIEWNNLMKLSLSLLLFSTLHFHYGEKEILIWRGRLKFNYKLLGSFWSLVLCFLLHLNFKTEDEICLQLEKKKVFLFSPPVGIVCGW